MTSQSIRNINDNMALSVTSICMQGYTPSHLSSYIIGEYFVSMLLITCISLNEYRDKGGDIFTVKYIIYSIFNAKCSQFTNIYSKYQIWFFSGGVGGLGGSKFHTLYMYIHFFHCIVKCQLF